MGEGGHLFYRDLLFFLNDKIHQISTVYYFAYECCDNIKVRSYNHTKITNTMRNKKKKHFEGEGHVYSRDV